MTGRQKWIKRFEELGGGDIETGAMNFIKMSSTQKRPPRLPPPNSVPRARDSRTVAIRQKISILAKIATEDFEEFEIPHPATGLVQRPDELTALNALSRLKKTGRCFNEVEKELRQDLRAALRHYLQSSFLFKNAIPNWWKEVAVTHRMAEAVSTEASPTIHHREFYRALQHSNLECKDILTTMATKREEEAIWQRDWYFSCLEDVKVNARRLLLELEPIMVPDI
jgi:hypothetical protein